MKRILILNGPNLNLQGSRQTDIYGTEKFDRLLRELKEQFTDVSFTFFQSNVEGELVDKLQQDGFLSDGIVLNAGAYSHTSIALHDCIKAISAPVIEVHISNIYAREEFRHKDVITSVCKGMIAGLGMSGYRLAVEALLDGDRQSKEQ